MRNVEFGMRSSRCWGSFRIRHAAFRTLLLLCLLPLRGFAGEDLRLSYRSNIDNTDQPYRIYIPGCYDGRRPLPVVIAMHGTSGNESTLFDDERYGNGAIKRAAEKHCVLLVSPWGRGVTEYRGIGETDIFCVLADVRSRYRIDEDRLYLTGHSMGGSGAAYLAMHHPDIFAASAPLAAPYSFPWLAENARRLPFWWIEGAQDEEYYRMGVAAGVERMQQLGCPVKKTTIPGEGHFGPVKDLDGVIAWLLGHKRDPHPRGYVFLADTPLHGRAWWTRVDAMERPGEAALLWAGFQEPNTADFDLRNVARFSFLPDPQVFDLKRPLRVLINGVRVFSEPLGASEELEVTGGPPKWKATKKPRREAAFTVYRNQPVAFAPEALDMRGTEAPLANWITDAMRQATGADIALYNRQYYRGLPIPQGTVDIVDLVQCSRPFDQYLVTVRLAGRDLIEILDANIPNPKTDQRGRMDGPEADRLIQLSGASYAFARRQPPGKRILETDLQPDRMYTVVMEGQAVERETILLAGRFKKLDYKTTSIPFSLALYGHAARAKRIEARLEGRVKEQ